ncbi:hypothetical protein AHMF7616_02834 [Adhaeribacter pallidiroseus]|uniref:Uncharacterized protein n=1 Tax=Adhaeribacter pallidiroseus TaxID=2072847 RepID=A0A369QII6_9BACT|nr:hypothetical protein AHMF7616_02834 [Adhaeribacter pallidiroseus]
MENKLQHANAQQADNKKIVVPCSMCSGNHEKHVPNCPNDYTVFAMLLKDGVDGDPRRF